MNAHERLLLPENLNYAWIKVKNLYRSADGFVDMGELAAFELDLERRLLDIRRQFERGTYRLKKLRPLPRPKKLSDAGPVNRQYFHVALEDQVAWVAMVNAIGPDLDMMMEPWSYGNRLYRPAWYEKNEASTSTLEIGPYRHASGHLYRKFQHSWPLFRRHVTLTARMMVLRRPLQREEMDEADQLADATARRANLAYFDAGFWPKKTAGNAKSDLYHASIDLKQFYPALKIEAVLSGLAEAGGLAEPKIEKIIASMLNFQIDMTDMPETALENVDPRFLKGGVQGIPTGLFVAGFLANAAMLPVDKLVAKKINEQRNVAHFRFVDDHTVIAYDFEELCEWIAWYEKLLLDCGIGAVVNTEKYDPPSLAEWMILFKTSSISELRSEKPEQYGAAMRDARLDGKNPTKLMTKTLAQVSAIAATDIHMLDDEDLGERLKMLEWLLLADIPEREIRPDTRAAFAAGQIASLVPVLVQEADGLVEAERQVSAFRLRQPDAERSTDADRQQYKEKLAKLIEKRDACQKTHDDAEITLLGRCFSLLLQSLREHPGKARLFYRIHQYCRVTGHRGLKDIADWLAETRAEGRDAWADYYVALSLQIMAIGILAAVRQLSASNTLRSDVKAAINHLEDIASLDAKTFRVPFEREAWFHAAGRREFGIALMQAAAMLAERARHTSLSNRLARLAASYVSVSPGSTGEDWLTETGRTSGVWAHLAENVLGREAGPSAAWSAFAPHFAFDRRPDLQAARRYPEQLSDAGWSQLLAASEPLPESDSAWLREVIGNEQDKRAAAYATGKIAFTRAARSLEPAPKNWMTIDEWTANVHACSSFDPRRGEWTALEITAQLIAEATSADSEEAMLDRLHPNNVLLPRSWTTEFPCERDETGLNWVTWRHFAQNPGDPRVKLREPSTSLSDYRYTIESRAGIRTLDAERRLVSVGRLLLGLLRNNHAAPRIWNLRGNELIFRLPRSRWFEALAVSSPTTLILEGCLGARPAETRSIYRQPDFFGWRNGENPNDATFDPPLFYSSTDLLDEIRRAQKILEDNQLAVAMNQPRQLIPFRLSDFAAGSDGPDAADGEGRTDGE
jgi:hypothetical protein